jgi:peptidyl-prolyl cis-trans isomerase C
MNSRSAFLAVALFAFAAPAFAQADDPVVARVNGKELRRSDVAAMQKSLPPQAREMPIEMIFPILVEQMVSQQLITEAARKEKLGDDPELKAKVARYEERLVQEAWLSREVEKAASEDKLKEKYEEFVKENPPKEEVSARHILVEKEDDAKAIIRELEKGGDFAKIAKEKSKDPAGATGGDLGFFSREEMVPEFSEQAFKMKKGEITKTPVKTQFGWHVIKVEEKRSRKAPDFEQVKAQIEQYVTRKAQADYVAKLRAEAKVERMDQPADAAKDAKPADAAKPSDSKMAPPAKK